MKKVLFNKKNTVEQSYQKHKAHQESLLTKGVVNLDYGWLNSDSYDTWRHQRMYSLISPLISKGVKWMTVGDGRYGSDAHYLLTMGADKVLSTDISDKLLRTAKKDKYISGYKEINAESIKFADDSFDYLLCKESFHHFPRPMVALYEMIRVAKLGVVLIEPNDTKSLMTRKYPNHFEVVGNFLYPISLREVGKVSKALDLPCIGYKGIDDVYIPGGHDISMTSINIRVLKAKATLLLLDILHMLKIRERSILSVIIFKTKPEKRILNKLEKNGYAIIHNSPNPYLNRG